MSSEPLPKWALQTSYPGTCADCGAEHVSVTVYWVETPTGDIDYAQSKTLCMACCTRRYEADRHE